MLEKLFQLKAHNTNVRTEILAGVTTFLTMAYILFVNPAILGETGMDKGAIFVATCLAAAIGSVALSIGIRLATPEVPFMNRVGIVFVLALVLGVLVSLSSKTAKGSDLIRTDDVSYRTSASFNVGALVITCVVAALYYAFW